MKPAIFIILCLVLLTSCVSPITLMFSVEAASISQDRIEGNGYTRRGLHENKGIMRPDPETLRRWVERYNHAQTSTNPTNEDQIIASFGANFNLLPYLQYVPSERDQGSCGNCWVWAGTGIMEIALSVQEKISDRLSIQFFTSCWHDGAPNDWACCGGCIDIFADWYQQTGFAVPWSNTNAHWQDGDRECPDGTSVPGDTISTTENYPIKSCTSIKIETYQINKETAINNIKQFLHQHQAICFSFYMATDDDWQRFSTFWMTEGESKIWNPDYSCEHLWKDGGGHAVLCIGYNDTDPENRYWIMLNSWGTANGNRPHGIFLADMDLNNNCTYQISGGECQSFFWETLDISYDIQRVIIDQALTSDDRADLGSIQTIGFHAKWSTNGSDVIGGSLYVNGLECITNGFGWISYNCSSSTVGITEWTITGVDCGAITRFLYTVPPVSIIWDQVDLILDVDNERIDIGENATIVWSGIYQYDRTPFTGTVILNDTQTQQEVVNHYAYKVDAISDPKYGLTVFSSNCISIIWDCVNITLSVMENRINLGAEASITWHGSYQYDGRPFIGAISLNDTTRKSVIEKYIYLVESITDPLYWLKAFTTNEVYCIFDKIEAKIKVETIIPGSMTILVEVKFTYDDFPVDAASVTINELAAKNQGNGIYKVTLSSWTPSLLLTIQIDQAGFDPLLKETRVYSWGNIILELLLPAIGVVAIIIFRKGVFRTQDPNHSSTHMG